MTSCESSGVLFSNALREKYFNFDHVETSTGITLPTIGGGQREIEYARSEKLSQQTRRLEDRIEIGLQNQNISCIDVVPELMSIFKNLQLMDLSFNKISSWQQLALLCESLPSLEHLIITGNPLEYHDQRELSKCEKSFSKLKKITMGKLGYDWKIVHDCSGILWPDIEYLDLFSNNISVISSSPTEVFSNLKHLILDQNPVFWTSICNLSHLRSLECLQLVGCSIESIILPSMKGDFFPSLKHLDLKNNNINSWRDIVLLDRLPSLQELIIRGNPIYESFHHDHSFNMVLSILGRLQVLNRQQITKSLRKEGEIYYLRSLFTVYLEAKKTDGEKFYAENPRYLEILEKYGLPSDLLNEERCGDNKLITLTIFYREGNQEIEKRIPKKTPISALRTLVKRLLSIDDFEKIKILLPSKSQHGELIHFPS
ncbi:tubulin-binding cofactor E isoform X2 [Brevipalpus obovatus]|uniref:tubulin-binding cofactor E isoform X2 n=1 Tax=Brevipalpus obovatus TaxID=246614 RepID=UPI003D9EBFF9